MSASALMSLGVRAMSANYAALQATGHNISNANTEGYSRQSVVLETNGGQFTGAGFFGKGVNVATVQREHSDFLTREASTTKAIAAADEARSSQLQQLEKVFPLGEDGIGYAATSMFNALVDVANKPADTSARQVVLARAGEFATRVKTAGEQLDTLQQGVTEELKASITQVNMLAGRVAELNQKIAAVKGSGQSHNDLLDQRDQTISEISRYVQVTTMEAGDGSMSVFIGGGQKLVLGNQATRLVAVADAYDPSRLQLGVNDSGAVREMPQELVTGGSIAGLLRFQNDDLVSARNQLGQIAAAVAGSVNRQQALGLDGSQPPASGAPLLTVGAPQVLPASSNTGGATVSISVSNPTELQASDYELVRDPALPAGSYTLTRLSDGNSQTVTDGAIVDGFQISIGATAPAANDRFLLQPVSAASRNATLALENTRGLAAASPVAATFDVDNIGTASVAALSATAVNAAAAPLTATITFTNDSGAYNWELRDASNALVRSGTGTWSAGQAIRSDAWAPATPAQRYDWSLDLSGVPRSGDVLTVGNTPFPASDNGNAKAMMALRDAGLVGQSTLPSGTVVPGASVTDAYANMLAEVGVRVQGAQLSAKQSAAIADQADANLSAKVGVNLDEEAARLIQFQQSYQAAAKILQVAQSLFDTLLQTAG
ncbi:MAG: flagellar hook-associated protein FlgK [Piscinibacter sp.]|uniref:flagellar hook-associated protein FlgK n=2 Tax=Piscinibacter sp. TaxID=1903157 RepID=UPI001B5E2625|nr:flagellar hook-associated protein FlgK [Piscinibacter sp.]MBP5988663.1 flagellar hook-associated protein FlgK [Piscinibacter sp.]MBP6025848.1 flagellar hook-associated protein FlgK [Piscinibacter sp.]